MRAHWINEKITHHTSQAITLVARVSFLAFQAICKTDEDEGDRTLDLRIRSPTRYPLRYAPGQTFQSIGTLPGSKSAYHGLYGKA